MLMYLSWNRHTCVMKTMQVRLRERAKTEKMFSSSLKILEEATDSWKDYAETLIKK